MTSQPTHEDAIRLLSKPQYKAENAGKLAILRAAQNGVSNPAELRRIARQAKNHGS